MTRKNVEKEFDTMQPIKMKPTKTHSKKIMRNDISKPVPTRSYARVPGQGKNSEISAEKNAAPSQWGRRLARLVGEKFGVQMVENHAKNEGTFQGKDICIKCAKSHMPPVSVLVEMLDRIDQLWAVYLLNDNTAQIWAIDARQVRKLGYFTHGEKVQKRVEIYLRHIVPVGTLVGTLTEAEVESCRIP